jgi:hypothetical protein
MVNPVAVAADAPIKSLREKLVLFSMLGSCLVDG